MNTTHIPAITASPISCHTSAKSWSSTPKPLACSSHEIFSADVNYKDRCRNQGCTRSEEQFIAASGEVAEWLMAPVLKTGVPERVPGVRIPPLPPSPYPETSKINKTRNNRMFTGYFVRMRQKCGGI